MALTGETAHKLLTAQPAWPEILEHLWTVFSTPPATGEHSLEDLINRDKAVIPLDNLLSGAAWELWQDFEQQVPSTSQTLAQWWQNRPTGRAVLILDALSLRELPDLLEQARTRGYTLHQTRITGAELPPDTTPFAHSPMRSALLSVRPCKTTARACRIVLPGLTPKARTCPGETAFLYWALIPIWFSGIPGWTNACTKWPKPATDTKSSCAKPIGS